MTVSWPCPEQARLGWGHLACGVAMLRIFVTVCALFLAVSAVTSATAQTPQEGVPANIRELVRLLEDPEVKAWLKAHDAGVVQTESGPADSTAASPSGYLAKRIAAFHQHLDDLAQAWPTLPDQFA